MVAFLYCLLTDIDMILTMFASYEKKTIVTTQKNESHVMRCFMIRLFLSFPSGSFGYRFTVPGVYYYSSGYIDDAQVRLLQGVVNVAPRKEKSSEVSVKVGGMMAGYVTDGT